MQTTVQSLEELAKQSKINYSVVADSPYMEYFQNMAGAEEELYKKWKEITLNSSSDQSKYRVWDYPVREQYTHILKVLYMYNLNPTSKTGFRFSNRLTGFIKPYCVICIFNLYSFLPLYCSGYQRKWSTGIPRGWL